jgi:hypothetical protein
MFAIKNKLLIFCSLADVVGLELTSWPVLGSVNHILYKNVYCAICNGLHPSEQLDVEKYQDEGNIFSLPPTIPELDWLTAVVQCPPDDIISYLENKPNHNKLIQLISG